MNIPNPFIDCSLDELVEAWSIFSSPRENGTLDHEAMQWVAEAVDKALLFKYTHIPNPSSDEARYESACVKFWSRGGGINIIIMQAV